MKSKLMDEVMDAVGELPDFGNLLLRESGYPHLDDTPKQSQSDAWNEAGTWPSKIGVYETRLPHHDVIDYQVWRGQYWAYASDTKEGALSACGISNCQDIQWREVQP
jgi:hypothetical protein